MAKKEMDDRLKKRLQGMVLGSNTENKTRDVLGVLTKNDNQEKMEESKQYEGTRVAKATKKEKEVYQEKVEKILQKPKNRNLSQETQEIIFGANSEYIPMDSDIKQGIPNQFKSKFITYEQERVLSKQLAKLVRKSDCIDLEDPENSLLISLLNPIYRDIVGTRDYVQTYIDVNFSIGNEDFKAEVNRFTGYIKDSTITIDSLYQSMRLVEDEQSQLSELDICVNAKIRDELSKKRVLVETENEISNSRLSDENKIKAIENLHSLMRKADNVKTNEIKDARKNDTLKAYEVKEDSKNPLENRITKLVYSILENKRSEELTIEEQDLLNKVLNTMYYNVSGEDNIKDNMIQLNLMFANKPYSVDVNTYTGFVNGTEHNIETFYKILKIINMQIDMDVHEVQDCVNQKRVDEYIKGRVLTVVKSKIYSNDELLEADKQEMLDNLKILENWIDIEKTTEYRLAREKNRISKSLGLTQKESEIEATTILKREFYQDNKDRIASKSKDIDSPVEVKTTIIVMQEELIKQKEEEIIQEDIIDSEALSEMIKEELSSKIEIIDEGMNIVVEKLQKEKIETTPKRSKERDKIQELEIEQEEIQENLKFKEMVEIQIARDEKNKNEQEEVTMEVAQSIGKVTEFDFAGMTDAYIKKLYHEGRIVNIEEEDIIEIIEVIEER